jgi:hypothetical protein
VGGLIDLSGVTGGAGKLGKLVGCWPSGSRKTFPRSNPRSARY